MAKGDKIKSGQSSKIEREKLQPLDQLFANLKQGPSEHADVIRNLESGRYGRFSKTADEEYSEAVAHWLGGWGMLYHGWEGWREEPKQQLQDDWAYMREKLKDSILVDLGCGARLASGFMFGTMDKYSIAAYVGVDRYAWPDTSYDPTLNQWKKNDNRKLIRSGMPPIAKVHADMLDFVARLPDNSVNFVLNGIDRFVISTGSEYHRTLAKEMIRALKPGGIICGADFTAISHLFDSNEVRDLGLRRHHLPSSRRDFECFEKIIPDKQQGEFGLRS